MASEIADCLQTLLADKGYDSASNRKQCRSYGISVHIPMRKYQQTRKHQAAKNTAKEKQRKKLFNKPLYNRRTLIESVNSAIKRTLGSYVNNRKASNQQKQVTIKAINYNIEHTARRIKN